MNEYPAVQPLRGKRGQSESVDLRKDRTGARNAGPSALATEGREQGAEQLSGVDSRHGGPQPVAPTAAQTTEQT
jgi:hypothetical protein